MYKCNVCDVTFDEPEEYKLGIGEYNGVPISETLYRCPICKHDDFDEVTEDEEV